MVIASTKGGKIPLDPTSLSETNLTGAAKAFQTNGAHLPAYRNYSLFWYQVHSASIPYHLALCILTGPIPFGALHVSKRALSSPHPSLSNM